MWTTRSTSSPTSSGLISICQNSDRLELQTRFAGAVGPFFDATVIDETIAVEDARRALEGEQLLADRLAAGTRAFLFRLAVDALLHGRLRVRSRREHAARVVVDCLRVDMLCRAEHGEPRTL